MTTPRTVKHSIAILAIPPWNEDGWSIVGNLDHACNPRDGLVEIIELLSAGNYPFEVIDPCGITLETFLDGRTVKYSCVIVLPPFFKLSYGALKILEEISYNHGVSLVCSLEGPVPSESPAWGIRRIGKKYILWPVHVKIKKWPGKELEDEIIAKYHPWAGLAGVRARSFKKLDFGRVAKKIFSLFSHSFIPFRRLLLDEKAVVLAESKRGFSLVHSFRYGKAINYCFSFDFHRLLEKYNEMHRLFRTIIEINSGFGMVSVDLEGVMALRIDDPGACVSDYLDGQAGALKASEWEKVGTWLVEKGYSASVMYTPQWVDDGDEGAGTLYIDSKKVEHRIAGQAFPSPLTKYLSNRSDMISDHEDEFKGLLRMKESGVIDIQSHGLTHLLPAHERWASSHDRNYNSRWYHEYYNVIDDSPVGKETQMKSMNGSREEIARFFGSAPFVLTPSGHKHGCDSDIEAYKAGYLVFSSDFTSYKNGDMIIRNSKVPGIFLFFKNPNFCFLRSGYPFVGIVHDEDLLSSGLKQLDSVIHEWMKHGIKRVLSLRELATSLCLTLKSWYSTNPVALRIEVELPISRKEGIPYHFTGTKILLRIVLPEDFHLKSNSKILTGDGHLLFYSIENGRIIQLLLEIEENLKLELVLPLFRNLDSDK